MAEKIYQLQLQDRQDLQQIHEIQVNTSKPMKGLAAWVFLHTLTRGYHAKDVLSEIGERCNLSEHAARYVEPQSASARHSSEHKAGWLQLQDQTAHSSGMDSVAYIWKHGGKSQRNGWEALHKLDRHFPNGLPPAQIASEYRHMRDMLVFPGSGKLHLAWDLSVTYINGAKHTFNEMLLVETKPIEQQLFWQKFDESLKSGAILKRAPRIDLIETVFQNDQQARIGMFTTDQIRDYGTSAWNRLQPAGLELQRLATAAVLTTVPQAIFMQGNNMDIFEKAWELSSQIGEVWQ
jgi:hypothetical protein